MAEKSRLQQLSGILLRVVCYGALLVFALSWVALDILSFLNACPRQEAVAVTCSSDTATWIRSTSMTVLISGIFLGFPFLLGGLAFLVYDAAKLINRWRGRRSA